ncbi:hypothetical protein [Oceanobacillus sp. FSL H7-0719]|uniref:hypothetical protein n=1 Tax=Oceanobacillus sp. FSL H7-0719 TaxID=2954507 RepID=UPI0032435D9B
MDKFPVISKNGSRYKVRIKECIILQDHVEVLLYKEVKGKTLLGKEKTKLVSVNRDEEFNFYPSYNEVEWDFNYVEMAKAEISDYEKRVSNAYSEDAKHIKGIKEFEEWDGKI